MIALAMFAGGLSVLLLVLGSTRILRLRADQIQARLDFVLPKLSAPPQRPRVERRRRVAPAGGAFGSIVESQKALLAAASVDMPIATWLLVRGGSLGVALVLLLISPLLGLVGFVVAFMGPGLWLGRRKATLKKKIDRDLPDALLALANALRGGLSLNQSLSALATDFPPPLGDLFRETLQAVGLGSSIDASFETFADRTGVSEFHVLATAMAIQRQSGGNLSDILESVSTVIGEKLKLRAKVKALTAEPRLSAVVLSVLPIGVGLMIFFINPTFITPLVTSLAGHLMLGFAIFWEAIGVFFIRSVTRIE